MCKKHLARWKRWGNPYYSESTEPGTVRVDAVEFNGITFRRYPDSSTASHRRYYKPSGQWIKQGIQALHQEVWKAEHGPIPVGCHIHHADGDVLNNRLENLVCLTKTAHDAEHSEGRAANGRSEKQLAHLASIRVLTVAWHRSDAGREWHRAHAKNSIQKVRKTHCPRGHAYDEANTYITPSTGGRICRECHRIRARESYHRERARLQPDDE